MPDPAIPQPTDDELIAICEAASPGPWTDCYNPSVESEVAHFTEAMRLSDCPDSYRVVIGELADGAIVEEHDWSNLAFVGNGPTSQANATFIATFNPSIVRALLAERAELVTTKARLDTLQEALDLGKAFMDAELLALVQTGDAELIYARTKANTAVAKFSAALARIGESPEQETQP